MTQPYVARPVIRWAGSKRRQLPDLLGSAPHGVESYVEPFAGSAVLFFALQPKRAVLGDLNPHLMSFYRSIRRTPLKVLRVAQAFCEEGDDYYKARRRFNTTTDAQERAGLFLYLNTNCFNGLYRENKRGEFNVPRGVRTPPLPSESAVRSAAAALRRAELRTQDFEQTISNAASGSFIYADPPFWLRQGKGDYGPRSFRDDEMPRLSRVLREADKRGCSILLSLPERLTPDLGKGWRSSQLSARYTIQGNGRAPTSMELLWSNYL